MAKNGKWKVQKPEHFGISQTAIEDVVQSGAQSSRFIFVINIHCKHPSSNSDILVAKHTVTAII